MFYDSTMREEVQQEVENNNLDRCDVCKSDTDSEATRLTARRNPSRSAKRNVVYRENDLENMIDSPLYSIKQYCCKCSEVKTEPPKVNKAETLTMTIDDQPESEPTGHHQSEVLFLEKSSVKQKQPTNFKYNVCDKTFTQISNLKLHIRTVHDKVKAFECPHCSHKAGERGHLNIHILTHTGEKNFKCDICDKKFTQNWHLKVHIRTVHDKVKAFPCPHCPYKTAHSGTLKHHILTHTGEKNFKCDICDKKFARNGSLKEHIRTVHDKVKPFECPHCPYKAAQRRTLEQHILTHTGKKNFKCDICDKKFTHSSNLKRHNTTVHGIMDNLTRFFNENQ